MSASGGAGVVKSRDFVNLRCWRLVKNGQVIENYNLNTSLSKLPQKMHSSDGDNENSSEDEEGSSERRKRNVKIVNEKSLKKSASENMLNEDLNDDKVANLSKSLGAAEISCVTSEDDEPFCDAQTEVQNDRDKCCFVSAAISIDYPLYPPTSKYVRGDNIISCWAMRPINNEPDACVFEWILCIDLKGTLPKYVLNAAFMSHMSDTMVYLRKRIQQLLSKESSNCA